MKKTKQEKNSKFKPREKSNKADTDGEDVDQEQASSSPKYSGEANSSESSNLLKKIIIYLNKPYEDQHGISDFQVPSKVNEKKYKTFCGT